uniref:Uncharacterized protein n=1 Tax=Triticum urartu TaxID=4572 RepID=A0A8R7QX27_TRIUA
MTGTGTPMDSAQWLMDTPWQLHHMVASFASAVSNEYFPNAVSSKGTHSWEQLCHMYAESVNCNNLTVLFVG